MEPELLSQTFAKLNPKLQPMVELIKANRSKWEELHHRHQRSQETTSPGSPRNGDAAATSCSCAGTSDGGPFYSIS
ncbi:dual 3, 5 -cyclic-AMP and -GMP phosphodiesterase 11A [Labeo rohita]|uniref:Dual 3, 5-cyclic-AMP and-GMP phosphodiesterase 11A n=1 Tax=Labeo rohita TaxID=84645 RepID=A0A498NWT8_LABRO|nr:dual 3, 5 -cyclic-AMP and -GMP phosphodiesterase 11A [Labeo rohita]